MKRTCQTLPGVVAAWLLAASMSACAETAEYICLGHERGQEATVIASSTAEAVALAKSYWRSAGCYKK